MTKRGFEGQINELLDKIYDASPKEKEIAMQILQAAIDSENLAYLRKGIKVDDEDLFDNVPL